MNRVNYVAGREITSADLNAIQADVESHLRSMAKHTLIGIVSGMAVTGTKDGLQVAPGFAWDSQGQRMAITAPTAVDVSALVRPAAGSYRWVLVHAAYQSIDRGTVTDVARVSHSAYADDGATLGVVAGPEFAAASIAAARRSRAGRPDLPAEAVLLGRLIMDHASTWGALGAGVERPPLPPPERPGDIIVSLDTEVPEGWIPLDGRVLSRAENPAIFRILGAHAGAGDGSTTFTLPVAVLHITGGGGPFSRNYLIRAG